jgi:putative hydrolase of the HAD superfamily
MRKPNSEIYKYVLNEHDLAKRTLFIDDKKENTDAAAFISLQVNFTEEQRDVVCQTYYRI